MYNIKSGVDNIQNVKNQNRLTYPEGESVFSNYKVTYKNGEIWYVQNRWLNQIDPKTYTYKEVHTSLESIVPAYSQAVYTQMDTDLNQVY